MATPYVGGSVITGTPPTTPVGDNIATQFDTATSAAATKLNASIEAASANPGDPTTMIRMQIALANYSLALSVQSSVIKSLEETAKSITQKL